MARITRVLLAAAAAVAAAGLAIAIVSSVSGHHATGGVVAPAAPEAVGRRASAAALFRSLRDRAFGGAAASAAAVGEAVDSAKEAVLALGPTYTPLAVSTGQALQAQLLAAQNAAYGLAQVRKAARRRECARVPRHRLASPHPTARAHTMRSASRAAWAAASTRCLTRTSRAQASTSSRPRTSYRSSPTLPASLPATCASRSTTPAC